MDKNTGKIKEFLEEEIIPDYYIPFQEKQMTKKQKTDMQVSKYDSISELGRLFTGCRKERRRKAKKLKKRLKKQLDK